MTKDAYLKARAKRLADNYNLSLDDYQIVLVFQKYGCGVCGVKRGVLHVDHCHSTGLVRGLLCPRHNRAIGKFLDNPEHLQAAADYLRNPPATQALGAPRFGYPGRIGTKRQRKALRKIRKEASGKT